MARGSRKDARSSRRRDVPAQSIHPFDPERLATALREMDAKVLTDDGDIDDSWPINDQHLRLRETTFFTTRHGDIDVVVNPAAAEGYLDLARPTESFVFEAGGIEVRVANLERVIESKRASDRPKDRDVIPRLEALLRRRRGEMT